MESVKSTSRSRFLACWSTCGFRRFAHFLALGNGSFSWGASACTFLNIRRVGLSRFTSSCLCLLVLRLASWSFSSFLVFRFSSLCFFVSFALGSSFASSSGVLYRFTVFSRFAILSWLAGRFSFVSWFFWSWFILVWSTSTVVNFCLSRANRWILSFFLFFFDTLAFIGSWWRRSFRRCFFILSLIFLFFFLYEMTILLSPFFQLFIIDIFLFFVCVLVDLTFFLR